MGLRRTVAVGAVSVASVVAAVGMWGTGTAFAYGNGAVARTACTTPRSLP
jgi:hypothetical protein